MSGKIKFVCSKCGAQQIASNNLRGNWATCTNCSGKMKVPFSPAPLKKSVFPVRLVAVYVLGVVLLVSVGTLIVILLR